MIPADAVVANPISSSRADAKPTTFRAFDAQFWCVLALAFVIIIPRSILVSRAQNEVSDAQHHFHWGLSWLEGLPQTFYISDPPFGSALMAFPMWLVGTDSRKPLNMATMPVPANAPPGYHRVQPSQAVRERRSGLLYGNAYSPETLLLLVAIWQSLLFVPIVGLAFWWARGLYGTAAGWGAAALLTFDPGFAGMVNVACIDVLGVEGIVLACWLGWRCIEQPSWSRMIGAAVATGFAMSIKFTAFVMPLVIVAMAIAWWVRSRSTAGWRQAIRLTLWGALIVLLTIWALDRFDFSAPRDHAVAIVRIPRHTSIKPLYQFFDDLTIQPLPGGTYIAALIEAHNATIEGHWGYLLGEHRLYGWWYYFFVDGWYKVPLATLALMAIAIVSVAWRPPAFSELSLLIPALVLGWFISASGLDVGFRHFLGPYFFLLLLATRVFPPSATASNIADPLPKKPMDGHRRALAGITALATLLVAAGAVEAASFHPDYITYVNFPASPWRAITDTNLDYGQGLVAIRNWVDAGAPISGQGPVSTPGERPKRTIWLFYLSDAPGGVTDYWLGNRVKNEPYSGQRPTTGLLVVSPVRIVGAYDLFDTFGDLRRVKPVAKIGHCVLVYDMDALYAAGFRWTPPPLHLPDDMASAP
jgi:chromate transport protein ChrA